MAKSTKKNKKSKSGSGKKLSDSLNELRESKKNRAKDEKSEKPETLKEYKKIVLIFPGQGSQYVGMGKDFYDKYKFVRDIYDQANQVLGYDISEKCFRPSLGKKIMHRIDLDKTIYTQPAVLTMSYACFKVFEDRCRNGNINLDFSMTAGPSLGEYTALLVSGAMDFKTAVGLVKKRATYITEFSKSYPDAGLMAMVDKKGALDYDKIDAL